MCKEVMEDEDMVARVRREMKEQVEATEEWQEEVARQLEARWVVIGSFGCY